MPMVVVERHLRWNKKDFRPGVAVDMPEDVMDSLPAGVVRLMHAPTPPPVVEAPDSSSPGSSPGGPDGRPPFMPVIRPISS